MDAAVASLVADMGGIDVLLNNAGGSCTKVRVRVRVRVRAMVGVRVRVALTNPNPN